MRDPRRAAMMAARREPIFSQKELALRKGGDDAEDEEEDGPRESCFEGVEEEDGDGLDEEVEGVGLSAVSGAVGGVGEGGSVNGEDGVAVAEVGGGGGVEVVVVHSVLGVVDELGNTSDSRLGE